MKKILHTKVIVVIAYCLLTTACSFSQWTSDPNNPQLVSSEDNSRMNVQTHPDGNGGVYVFWRDTRIDSNNGDVYAQHYNSDGVAQWENDGREILDYSASISKYTTFLNEANGELFIASYTTGSLPGDSLRVRKLNEDGSATWVEDLAVAQTDGCSPPTYILSMQNLQMTISNDFYLLVYESTVCGGYTKLYLSSFTTDGELLSPYYGVEIPSAGGWNLQPTYDDTGDIFVSFTGFDNGYEAYLFRCSANGDIIFPSVNMTSGPTDLNYMYRILSDENGVTLAWVTGGNIYARRFDNAGNQLWDDVTLNICTAEGAQDAFYMQLNDNEVSVVWRDGRPGVVGNAAIYAQRFSLDGEVLWTADGIEVADLNTYVAYPKFTFNNNGDMIVCHISNVTGMTAHKVLDDGSVQWGPNGIVQCIPSLSQGSEDFKMIQSGENVIMAWQKSNFENEIYISRVYPQVTEIAESVTACDSYFINDVTYTQSGVYTIELPGDSLLILDLEIISQIPNATQNGYTLTANTEGENSWYNCDTETIVATGTNEFVAAVTGNYALIQEYNSCVDTTNCFLLVPIGVEEMKGNISISLYPNPASDALNIRSDSPLKNVSITLYDAIGQLQNTTNNLSFQQFNLDVSELSYGLYNVVIGDDERHYNFTFIKE